MKIIITTPELTMQGGVANYYKVLKNRFTANVEYFTVGSRPNEAGTWRTFSRFFTDNWGFFRKLKRGKYDIVHLNPSLVSKAVFRDGIFLLIAKLMDCKVLVFFRGWKKGFESNLNGWKLKVFKKIYFSADAMIVLAEEFRVRLRAWGYRGLVYVETTTFDDRFLDGFRVTNKLKVRNRTLNLLFLGQIVKEKGIYEALDAYRLVRSRGRDIRFTVAGDGPEFSAIKEYVRDKQVEGVDFPGFVTGKDKIRLLREADLFIFPSYASYGEGMPNSVVEAIAFGLPIVTRPVGGLADFFKNGEHGFISDSLDPKIFADLIEKLFVDKNLYNKISLNNYRYAQSHFLASDVALRLEKIYKTAFTG